MCGSCLSRCWGCVQPYLVHAACSTSAFAHTRSRMIPQAQGVVVEVGFGSGLNLPYYDGARVKRVVGVDPDNTMLTLARGQRRSGSFGLELLQSAGENMPLPDGFADTAVVTYALCTISSPLAALTEMRRVLKPTGRLIFVEHGQADEPRCRRWQERINRPWGWLAGGCHLDRDPLHLIREAGFRLLEAERGRFPLPFWQLGSHHAGIAAPSAT